MSESIQVRNERTPAPSARELEIKRTVAELRRQGDFQSRCGKYLILDERPVVMVRELSTGLLVAYSSSRADYDQSTFEFVQDYAGL